TRFSRDWSSDVCSSDLRFTREEALSQLLSNSNVRGEITPINTLSLEQDQSPQPGRANAETRVRAETATDAEADEEIVVTGTRIQIGRASCRERELIGVV